MWRCTVLVLIFACACATIRGGRYGVAELRVHEVEAFDDDAIEACLTTQDRDDFTIRVRGEPPCGEPPFGHVGDLELWSWPWTEWPLYDPVAFRQDLERIERWYAARGYYDARVVDVELIPEDGEPVSDIDELSECADREGCELDVELTVRQGRPTVVTDLTLNGVDSLDPAVREELWEALLLEEGARIDETLYDQSKERINEILADYGHALAEVEGAVRVDRDARVARVRIDVRPGPECVFGDVRVIGGEGLPVELIREATLVEPGEPYRQERLSEIQRAVYNLGTFASVVVAPVLPDEGNVVDVQVRVAPARPMRYSVGAGIQAGVFDTRLENIDVPQWDVHLLAAWEHRNLFGGLQRLRIENRPRLIFADRFPRATNILFGNVLDVDFVQPGFFEPRTLFRIDATWDWGPDPFDPFFRHDVAGGVAVERAFWDQRLFLVGGMRGDLYRISSRQIGTVEPEGPLPSDYHLLYFEQQATLDLRDAPSAPGLAAFFAVNVQEAGYFLPASWSYVRLTPEARGYVPLGERCLVAARFGLGMLFISEADQGLDPLSRQLGPRKYRLRGGGASSNRGFLPGQLGDGDEGGRRRWLANLELRARATENLWVSIFADAGDVHRRSTFRWDHPQVSVGLGLRYHTLVGPIRFDIGYRVPGLQFFGEDERLGEDPNEVNLGFAKFDGAVHLTIGEPF